MRLADLRHDLEHLVVHVLLGRSRGGGRVDYVRDGLRYRTVGLRAALSHPELEVEVSEERLIVPAAAFLSYVLDYMNRTHARIREGETMTVYGFWMVKFHRSSRGGLEAWDLVPDTNDEFQPNADLALDFGQRQVEMADRLHAEPDPPSAFRLFAADPGVLAGRPLVSMFRDPPTNQDHSGWFVCSDAFSGDLDELRNEHLYHLVARHPRLVRYLALPPGWHVDLSGEGQARFEEPARARGHGSAE